MPPDEGLLAARGAAGRALQLDPYRAEAQATLAGVAALDDCDRVEAERRWCLPSRGSWCRRWCGSTTAVLPSAARPLRRIAGELRACAGRGAAVSLGWVERETALCAVGRLDEGLAEFELACQLIRISAAVGYLGASTRRRAPRRRANVRRVSVRGGATPPDAVAMLAGTLKAAGTAIGPDRSSKYTAASAPGACRAPAPKLPGLRPGRCRDGLPGGRCCRTRSRRRAPFAGSARPRLLATWRWPAVWTGRTSPRPLLSRSGFPDAKDAPTFSPDA